jgi:hypothetical protein
MLRAGEMANWRIGVYRPTAAGEREQMVFVDTSSVPYVYFFSPTHPQKKETKWLFHCVKKSATD